jgi:hypothetical protein
MASTVLGAVFSSAYAFDLLDPPRKWFQGVGGGPDDLPVTFLINENGEESVADGDNGVTACIEATQWWEDELENGLNLLTLGTTPVNAVGRDGLNVVSFNDPARIVRRALAVSVVGWYDAGQTETVNGIEFGRYQESDVSFSKRYDYTTSAIGNCDGQFDIQAIQAQEIGHSLGLGHSNVSAAVMFGSIGSCVFKTIQPDDHDAINTVYNPGFGGITPCTPTEALLTEHSYSSPRRGRNCLVITVGVSNDCDNAVSGASVTVRLVGAEAGDTLSGTANTNGSGTVSFGLRCRDAASTTYVSTVMGIGGALSWNPGDPGNTADNPITCVITR